MAMHAMREATFLGDDWRRGFEEDAEPPGFEWLLVSCPIRGCGQDIICVCGHCGKHCLCAATITNDSP